MQIGLNLGGRISKFPSLANPLIKVINHHSFRLISEFAVRLNSKKFRRTVTFRPIVVIIRSPTFLMRQFGADQSLLPSPAPKMDALVFLATRKS